MSNSCSQRNILFQLIHFTPPAQNLSFSILHSIRSFTE
ncbi:Uncharacterised protein [Vibrio cholerae]|nr:Uncharacterised protein [Vibrio cholerae]